MICDITMPNYSGNRVVLSSLRNYEATTEELPFYSVKYVLKGTETYHMNGKDFPVSDSEFLLCGIHQKYSVEIKSSAKVDGICIFIAKDFFRDVFFNLKKSENFLLDNPFYDHEYPEISEIIFSDKGNNLGNTLQKFKSGIQKNQDGTSIDIQDFFYDLSVHWLVQQNDINLSKKSLEVKKKSTEKELIERLQRAKNLVNDEPERQWTMAELASAVSLSEFHFHRTFKKAFNQSPYQYIISRRLLKATDLLNRAFPLSDVALSSGFTDIYSFSRAFKKYTGICPSFYRQKRNFS